MTVLNIWRFQPESFSQCFLGTCLNLFSLCLECGWSFLRTTEDPFRTSALLTTSLAGGVVVVSGVSILGRHPQSTAPWPRADQSTVPNCNPCGLMTGAPVAWWPCPLTGDDFLFVPDSKDMLHVCFLNFRCYTFKKAGWGGCDGLLLLLGNWNLCLFDWLKIWNKTSTSLGCPLDRVQSCSTIASIKTNDNHDVCFYRFLKLSHLVFKNCFKFLKG